MPFSPSHRCPPSKKTYFTLLSLIFHGPRGFHLGTSGLYISYFNQSSLPHYSFPITMLP
jgi:hypothetical protein